MLEYVLWLSIALTCTERLLIFILPVGKFNRYNIFKNNLSTVVHTTRLINHRS